MKWVNPNLKQSTIVGVFGERSQAGWASGALRNRLYPQKPWNPSHASPGGAHDNSPALQRWESAKKD